MQTVQVPFHKVLQWACEGWDDAAALQQDIKDTVYGMAQEDEKSTTSTVPAGRPKQTGLPEDFPRDLWPRLVQVMKDNIRDNPDAWFNDRGTPASRPKTEQYKLEQGIVIWNNGIEAVFLTDDSGWPDPDAFIGPTKPWEA